MVSSIERSFVSLFMHCLVSVYKKLKVSIHSFWDKQSVKILPGFKVEHSLRTIKERGRYHVWFCSNMQNKPLLIPILKLSSALQYWSKSIRCTKGGYLYICFICGATRTIAWGYKGQTVPSLNFSKKTKVYRHEDFITTILI